MGGKNLIYQGVLQTDLDCAHFRLVNLDTSNLPPSGIPPTVIPPAHNWLRTWDSSALVWGFSQPNFTDLSGNLSNSQQLAITAVGTVRTGTWQASQIIGAYLPNLNGIRGPTANLSMDNFRLTDLADPIDAQDAVTKSFMDNLLLGLNPKEAVRCATTTSQIVAGLHPVDDVAIIAGDRVLVKDQAAGREYENGIYVAGTGVWVRASDANSQDAIARAYCFVKEGTVNGGTSWVQVNVLDHWPPTIGDILKFVIFSTGNITEAGAGLSKVGNTISAVGTANRIAIGASIDIDGSYVGQASITTLGTITTGLWHGSIIPAAYGGTGISNTGTITTGLNVTFALAALAIGSMLELDITGDTQITLPRIGTLSTLDGAETITNKRFIPRTGVVASSDHPTINSDSVDVFSITTLSVNIVSMTTNLTGSPVHGQKLTIFIKDNGTPRTITWGASFGASTDLPLPTDTVANKWLFLEFSWNNLKLQWILVNKLNNI